MMAELSEPGKEDCCNKAEIAYEETKPEQSSSSDSFSSGRMLFKGVDMAFLTVNGDQMFTLNEILEKLFPATPRTTVCTRMERMNASRHACSKEEIQKLKALGGARPSAINCTVIARKDVVEYCRKFNMQDNIGIKDKSFPKKDNVNVAYLKNLQTNGPVSEVFLGAEIKSDSVATSDDLSGTNGAVKDLQIYKSNDDVHMENATNAAEIQTGANESGKNRNSEKRDACFDGQNVRESQLSNDAVTWNTAGEFSQLAGSESVGGSPNASCIVKQERSPSSAVPPRIKRKRIRRTSAEILRSCSSKIIDGDGILHNKRQRKIFTYNQKRNKRRDKKKLSLPVDDSSESHPTCYLPLDLTAFSSSSKPSQRQAKALNPEGEPTKCHLDDNNNNVDDPLQPRSPTLLLKRSVNNEWRIAKSSLPLLSFDDEEQANGPDERVITKVKNSQALCAISANTTSTNFKVLQSATAVSKPAVRASSHSGKTVNKMKTSETIGCSSRKARKKSVAIKPTDEQFDSQVVIHSQSNVQAKFIENHHLIDKGKTAKSSINRSKNASISKPKKIDAEKRQLSPIKESSDGLENAIINKTNADEVIKRKRKRRVQMNTFCLTETIPYPSLLMVKDGDLCPSYSMAYSCTKHVPGCCHPLWRWRLGKPVALPAQISQAKTISGEQQTEQRLQCQDRESGENESLVASRNEEFSSKESIDSPL